MSNESLKFTSQIPSSTPINSSGDEELLKQDKLIFDNEIQELRDSIINSSQIKEIGKSIKITKNDSINKRVTQVLQEIESGNSVLLTSISNSIPKSIAIVEIVKQRLKEKKVQFTQFNKMARHVSTVNPNYKYGQQTKHQRVSVNPYLQEKLADAATTKQIQAEKEDIIKSVRGYKVYQLPVLHTLIVIGDGNGYELINWTTQTE
ncbi:uncharacterized protein RJT21DRAFT_118948 [Scheffersomyces amazonensis]|uniref:uncharacterized protein n=1 Tax=Scheffersomyces amazonensis TaxID=1078765 RepID=UPI00315D611E